MVMPARRLWGVAQAGRDEILAIDKRVIAE